MWQRWSNKPWVRFGLLILVLFSLAFIPPTSPLEYPRKKLPHFCSRQQFLYGIPYVAYRQSKHVGWELIESVKILALKLLNKYNTYI